MRWLVCAAIGGVLLVGDGLLAATWNEPGDADSNSAPAGIQAVNPIVQDIVFAGLRRIRAGAVRAQISSRAGEKFDAKRVELDVKALGRLGWFEDVRVEMEPVYEDSDGEEASRRVRLIFWTKERPFVSQVDFSGSKLLSASEIEKILSETKLAPGLGRPADPRNFAHIARTIRMALEDLGHPEAEVRVLEEAHGDGTVRVHFAIEDGPHIPVGQIQFAGQVGVPEKVLRREMRRTAPGGILAAWQNKGAFTREGFAEDRSRLLIYYQNHGFPEAQVGNARVALYENRGRRWIPWLARKREERFLVTVPAEAGPFYRVDSVTVSQELVEASGKRGAKLLAVSKAGAGSAYSAKALEDLRRAWVAASEPRHEAAGRSEARAIECVRTLDTQVHAVRVTVGFSEAPPYVVRRIEFRGLHRFSDRYLRRRIGLREGQAFDERALEEGLARVARTGYFHQIKKEDIQVRTDDATHTADLTIRVSEAGQQRASFSGGQGQFGSTLGVAYALFDVLKLEELLTAQMDVGPESLQVALGLVMEGFLGTRSSLAFSVFNNVLRPRFARSVKGPFYASRSEGLNAGWSYPVSGADSFGVNYGLSRTRTDYSFAPPASLQGVASGDLRAKTSSSEMGVGWTHDTSSEKWSLADSVSGGLLGGNENVIRTNEEYERIFRDKFLTRENAWALRTTFSGAGSYAGEMPAHARLFTGDAQVRGLNAGELGPYAVVPAGNAGSGNPNYTALPAGANVVSAANAEYRFPLRSGLQGAGFFDLGSGWLLPNWLGPARPTLLSSTNGILHGSLGLELRWTVPEVQVPVRAYFAVNVIRLNRFLALPDGTFFHAHNRLFAFGWALGSLF